MNTILHSDLFKALSMASSDVYLYVCDVADDLSRWSLNAVTYFDMPGEYMKNAGQVWLQKIHPEDAARYQADIEAVFSGRARRHQCEYRAMNRYGDYVWLECRGTMIFGKDGRPSLFAGMMTRLDANAKYDPLTRLQTMREFNAYDFSRESGAILLLGIDGFREIINNFGYSFGNLILAEFSEKLRALCGPGRPAYRLDGDELMVILPGGDRPQAQRLFDDMRLAALRLGRAAGRVISVGFSGGAVLYPGDGTQRDLLISNLEHSLEHAKRHSRGRLVFFSQQIARRHNRSIQLKHALTRSIQDAFEGFELHYQFLVERESRRAACCEALLRWRGRDGESAGTSEVVRLLEDSGEICQVGRWAADEVLRRASRWQREYPGFRVSFNVSYLQFQEPSFVDYLIAKSVEYRLDPSLVVVELTESCKVEDLEGLADCFRRLRGHGFRLSLDDFGIAYSTLLLIRSLPVDYVKIDQSFVLNLTPESKVDLAIIESVVSLCRALGVGVVAEGVETAETLSIMERFPIAYFQGYHFARPLPLEAFELALAQSRRAGGRL